MKRIGVPGATLYSPRPVTESPLIKTTRQSLLCCFASDVSVTTSACQKSTLIDRRTMHSQPSLMRDETTGSSNTLHVHVDPTRMQGVCVDQAETICAVQIGQLMSTYVNASRFNFVCLPPKTPSILAVPAALPHTRQFPLPCVSFPPFSVPFNYLPFSLLFYTPFVGGALCQNHWVGQTGIQ